ncbi:hypothetical protein MTP99_012694 [Tenebrio molitor]|nr:hypothetical protein MTP99_012694 [Tenebrio molitor]
MDESATNRSSIDIKEILARFTTDIIGSVAFGLDCNSLKDPDALFRKYGKKIFAATSLERVKLVVQFGVPHSVLKMFKFKVTNPDVEKCFMKAVKDTVDHREKNNIYRKDFMQLLIPYVRKILSIKMVFTPEQKIFMMNLIFAMVIQFTHFEEVVEIRFVLRKILRLSNVKWKTNFNYLSVAAELSVSTCQRIVLKDVSYSVTAERYGNNNS